MNFRIASALAGLVLITSAAPAFAGDYGYGGGSVKDMGGYGGVAVPAPVPIPVYKADYYIRGDFGVGLTDTMGVNEEGLVYGQDCCGNDVTVPDSWSNSDGHIPMTFGVGVGRYWSDRFRTDLTLDWVRQQNAVVSGSMTYTNIDGATATAYLRDETTKEAGVFLVNAYYDFNHSKDQRIVPYIGAGVGFAVNILDRTSQVSQEICDACGSSPITYDDEASAKSTTLTFAAAAMVGFTYDLGHSALLDVNYRYLHIGGSEIGLNVFDSRSTVAIDAQNEHQLRAGIRFNID
ncbi:MAG: porin family protein [Hyphomicrobiaceae bacterium]|nr:porin family protein [Hyphomicrobiaceae bacterium]